jgi:DNA gyrase subunit A
MTDTAIGQVIPLEASDALPQFYIPYMKEVILDRAFPDLRDGLKPIQRKLLISAEECGMLPGRKLKKSAVIIGACLGK